MSLFKGIPKCCYMLTYISHKIHKYHGMSHRILQIYALLEKRWFNFHSFPSIYPPTIASFLIEFSVLGPSIPQKFYNSLTSREHTSENSSIKKTEKYGKSSYNTFWKNMANATKDKFLRNSSLIILFIGNEFLGNVWCLIMYEEGISLIF